MTLQASGPISFGNIISEFGGNADGTNKNVSLGSYRIREFILNDGTSSGVGAGGTFYPISPGIPYNTDVAVGSTSIKMSNFYGQKKTIIISYSYTSTAGVALTGRTLSNDYINKYNSNYVGVGFSIYQITPAKRYQSSTILLPPLGNLDAKVVVFVNGYLGSGKDTSTGIGSLAPTLNRYQCALHLDAKFYNASQDLTVEIGPNGAIYGSGGNGGKGGAAGGVGYQGAYGGCAIGISTYVSVINNRGGRVILGMGGAGGGGGSSTRSGGGGGGGAGYPVGNGGNPGSTGSSPGNPGTYYDNTNLASPTGGTGGTGGTGSSGAAGGTGGSARVVSGTNNITAATRGSNTSSFSGGLAGFNGFAMVISSVGLGTTAIRAIPYGTTVRPAVCIGSTIIGQAPVSQ